MCPHSRDLIDGIAGYVSSTPGTDLRRWHAAAMLIVVAALSIGCSDPSLDLVRPSALPESPVPATALSAAIENGDFALYGGPGLFGARPNRFVVPGEPFAVPAGVFCPFPLAGEPDENARAAITEFGDGRVQVIGHGEPTLTNLATGISITIRSRYKLTVTVDAGSNELITEVSGRYFFGLFAGDQGPFGEVGESGALFRIVGQFHTTTDLESNAITSFTWSGQIHDMCADLS